MNKGDELLSLIHQCAHMSAIRYCSEGCDFDPVYSCIYEYKLELFIRIFAHDGDFECALISAKTDLDTQKELLAREYEIVSQNTLKAARSIA